MVLVDEALKRQTPRNLELSREETTAVSVSARDGGASGKKPKVSKEEAAALAKRGLRGSVSRHALRKPSACNSSLAISIELASWYFQV